MILYKFRSFNEHTKEELIDNYLYFATPEELNDPMEGFVKLYWDGDIVLWKNFLKHYLYTMTHCVITAALQPSLIKEELPVFINEENFPTMEYKELFEKIRNAFFAEEIIIELLECLQFFHKKSRKISQAEIITYLDFIRFHALFSINEELKKRGLLDWNVSKPEYNNIFKKSIELIPEAEKQYPNIISKMFQASNTIMADIKLSQLIEFENIDSLKKFFLYDFTRLYIQQINHIICSSPCTTCFMEQYNLPSLWGYYGDNHNGLCLIFDDEKDTQEISFVLKKRNYTIKTQTQKVKYQKKYSQINFFQMLGNLPKLVIYKYWLQDWENNITSCRKIKNSYASTDFTSKYYNYYFNNFCIKLPDWKKEQEHRIILQKDMFGCNSKEERKFTYDFSLLTGIIFGIKTTDEQKKEIIKIINDKCNKIKRKDFNFFRADYNENTGLIEIQQMKL